jgi:hypothetical protein
MIVVDLNYVFLRQQVERSRAGAARHEAARRALEELARFYELEIERASQRRIIFHWGREAAEDDPRTEELVSAHPILSASS